MTFYLHHGKRGNGRLVINSVQCILLAVILPTLLDYLQREFGADKFFYGLTLSAFSMANFLSGPLYGLAFDRTHQTKLIVLFGNLFEIGGLWMYVRQIYPPKVFKEYFKALLNISYWWVVPQVVLLIGWQFVEAVV